MLILGIESSCDDTAAAVVEGGRKVLSSVVSSQDDIHSLYGGVVPELASRRHIEMIVPVVDEALKRASVTMNDIDAIGVTQGPGLVGSLLIGLSFAKSVSYVKSIPYVGVNHLEAHPLAPFLYEEGEEVTEPDFPHLALVVSGGHTALIRFDDYTTSRVIGQTRDDAAGEAFDKVGKMLGLGFPGGKAIDIAARSGDPKAVDFKRTYLGKGNLEFSFSGIKTGVHTYLSNLGHEPSEQEKNDIAASFQEAVVDVLVRKLKWGAEAAGVSTIVAAGGVACNSRLRAKLSEMADREGLRLLLAPPKYCSDNGAMIALLAWQRLEKGERAGLDLNAIPNWDLL